MNMNESYSLDDLDQLELDQSAQISIKMTLSSVHVKICVSKTMGETHVLVRQSGNTARLLLMSRRREDV